MSHAVGRDFTRLRGNRQEVGERMKKPNVLIMMLVSSILTIVGSITASAESVGAGYTIFGYSAGWVFIGIAVIVIALILLKVLSTEIAKKAWAVAVALLFVGLILVAVQTPTATTTTTTEDSCPDFEITGTAVTSGTDYITTTVWDEDTLTLTVPLTVQDSSDGNLTCHKTGLNLTFDPVGSGYTADDITTVKFSSDYLMKYGGEYILDEDSTGYLAVWTTNDGTEYYDDQMDITADSSDWAQIDFTFVNATSGSWVTELDAIGDSKTWYISCSNDCGTWSETITVTAIVISYTA